jgi:vanillate O-demethylase ferredoxin subunit
MLKVRVVRKDIEALDICTVEFKSIDRRPLPAFSAGSHIDVHLPNGLIRQYSLCNAPSERHRYVIAVLKDPATRGGSQAIHELRRGDVLAIRRWTGPVAFAHEAHSPQNT